MCATHERAGAASPRSRLAAESGVTLVETLFSAVVLVIVLFGVFASMDAASHTTAVNRSRSVAASLAEQELERMRSLSAVQLATYSAAPQTKVVGKAQYTIESRAEWVNDASGTPPAATPTASSRLHPRHVEREVEPARQARPAGRADYMFKLGQFNDYWTLCDSGPGPSPSEPNPVNQRWDGTGQDTRRWRTMADGKSRYTIELLPATGATCTAGANAWQSMLNGSSGTFRIRATGRSGGVTRTIVTTLRRRARAAPPGACRSSSAPATRSTGRCTRTTTC
jgi:Tfp pilus assembly protein PilV